MDLKIQLKFLPSIQISKKGSGFLYCPNDGDHWLLFTARHCIQNKPFVDITDATRNGISLDFKNPLFPDRTDYKLANGEELIVPNNSATDLACIRLLKTELKASTAIPQIALMDGLTANTPVKFCGYPNYSTSGLRTVNGYIELDGHDTEFHIIPDEANFTDIDTSALEKVKGFSGSGVFTILENRPYLIGIIKQYEEATNRFIGTWISSFREAFVPSQKILDYGTESVLSEAWFDAHIKKATEGLGPRFNSEHFPVSLEDEFDKFVETGSFYKKLSDFRETLEPLFKGFTDWQNIQQVQALNFPIGKNNIAQQENIGFHEFLKIIDKETQNTQSLVDGLGLGKLDYNHLLSCLESLEKKLRFAAQIYQDNRANSQTSPPTNQEKIWEGLLRTLFSELVILADFLVDVLGIQRQGYLMIEGKAGSGKSQLSAFMAQKLSLEKHPTILLLGHGLIRASDVWDQILNQLQLINRDQFLTTLNKKAELENKLAIIIIDAMNEGMGIRLWNNYFTSFVNTVNTYERIRLVFTVRTTFKQAIFGNIGMPGLIFRHNGFLGKEMAALKYFCNIYEIPVPDPKEISDIVVDFANPLFLKLFCLASKNSRFKGKLSSAKGMIWIVNNFLRHVNAVLGTEDRNGYGYRAQRINLVSMAVDVLVNLLIDKNRTNWPYADAFRIVENMVGIFTNRKGFLDGLIDNEVFMENPQENDEHQLYLDFAYQKLGEYLIVDKLIAGKNIEEVKAEIKDGTISKLLTENTEDQNDGIFLALTNYVSESFQLDIFELLPSMLQLNRWEPEILTSVKTNPSAPTDRRIVQMINQRINSAKENDILMILDAILLVATHPDRHFNAEYLHDWLFKMDMKRRDLIWTQYINHKYSSLEEQTNISAIMNKCFEIIDSNVQKRLTAISVMWLLTSSNRKLRDDATKCLIVLLSQEIDLLIILMVKFKKVDDPYVRQRIMAVAYGVALNQSDFEKLGILCNHVLTQVFSDNTVVADVLYRDYATGIIEYGRHRGIIFSRSPDIAFGPFKSPSFNNFPTTTDIDKLVEKNKDSVGYLQIAKSMTTEYGRVTYGDFGRYVFGNAVRYWSIDEEGLSNYATKEIFDRYYSEVHSKYDQKIPSRRQEFQTQSLERLGKKYQWILFHEILARLADNYPFHDRIEGKNTYSGPWNPMVRDIDPTLVERYVKIERDKGASPSPLRTNMESMLKEFIHSGILLKEKLRSSIEIKDFHGDRWCVLESYPISFRQDKYEVAIQIRSYLVNDKKFASIKSALTDIDFWGRWMPEAHSTYKVFRGEFFWSNAVKEENIKDLHEVNLPDSGKYIGSIYPTAIDFTWEADNDLSFTRGHSSLIPARILSDDLTMDFFYDGQYYSNEELGLFMHSTGERSNRLNEIKIREESLQKLLKQKKMKIFWTVLGEIVEREGTGKIIKTFSGIAFYTYGKLNLTNIKLRNLR